MVKAHEGRRAERLIESEQNEFEPQPRGAERATEAPTRLRDRITKILFLTTRNSYVTTSSNGCVRVWDGATLELLHTAPGGGAAELTDALLLPDPSINKLVVSANDRSLTFFEMSAAAKSQYQPYGRVALPDLPCCLATWTEGAEGGAGTPVLAWGDDTGCVRVHDARLLVQLVSRAGEGRSPAHGAGLAHRAHLYTLRLHADWVTAMVPVPRLGALLTAGLDTNLQLADVSASPQPGSGPGSGVQARYAPSAHATLRTMAGHKKGVHALAVLSTSGRELAVSASPDRRTVVWNLQSGQRLGVLSGHRACVTHICGYEALERLVTLAADGELRVWETATLGCVQAISPLAAPALAECGAIAFNVQRECLVSGARELTLWQPRRYVVPLDLIRPTSLAPEGHRQPLVAVLYSKLLELVVAADESSVIGARARTRARTHAHTPTHPHHPHHPHPTPYSNAQAFMTCRLAGKSSSSSTRARG